MIKGGYLLLLLILLPPTLLLLLLPYAGEDQKPGSHTDSFSYIFMFDVSSVADGSLDISLLFRPGHAHRHDDAKPTPHSLPRHAKDLIRGGIPGRATHLVADQDGAFHGWVLVEHIQIFLALHHQGKGELEEDVNVGCAREVGLGDCRGCRVVAVNAGVASSHCSLHAEASAGQVSDVLLLDDQRRSALFARERLFPPSQCTFFPPSQHSFLPSASPTPTCCSRLVL